MAVITNITTNSLVWSANTNLRMWNCTAANVRCCHSTEGNTATICYLTYHSFLTTLSNLCCMSVWYTHFPISETSPSQPALPCSSTVYPSDMCYVSPASSVPAVCSMPQYFKQEIYFKQLTGFIFYIDQRKGTFLAVSVIRHTFTTTQNMKLLHISCMSENYYLPLALL